MNSYIWGLRPHYVCPSGMGRFQSFMFERAYGKGQLTPKSRLACHRFSQKMNKHFFFLFYSSQQKQTNKFIYSFFEKNLLSANLLTVLSDFKEKCPMSFFATWFVDNKYLYLCLKNLDKLHFTLASCVQRMEFYLT